MKHFERSGAPEPGLCLSAHELATLLVLLRTPVDEIAVTPDVIALREAGLAQLVEAGQGEARVEITDEGHAMLRVLGAA